MALIEDLSLNIDATSFGVNLQENDLTAQLIPSSQIATAEMITRESMILCGIPWVNATFQQLDSSIKIDWLFDEGDIIEANQKILQLQGPARALLTGERTAMNFLQTLSATATTTRLYVEHLNHPHCQLLDTRKTLPGLRQAQKYAVTVGGGHNHRMGLFDAFLIKENHIVCSGGITQAVHQAKRIAPNKPVEIEVEDLKELQESLDAKADIVMLDNFNISNLKQAVSLNKNHPSPAKLEASGNISLQTLHQIANTGVDFISVGALTKHITAIDLSLRVQLKQ